jgi:hypothetical protein
LRIDSRLARHDEWEAARSTGFPGAAHSLGNVQDRAVPAPILAAFDKAVIDERITGVRPQDLPAETGEEFVDGKGWPNEFFDRVEETPKLRSKALAMWASWARSSVPGVIEAPTIHVATSGSGRAFPPAVVRWTKEGCGLRADSARDTFRATALDFGRGARQWVVLSFLSNHPSRQGALVVHDYQPFLEAGFGRLDSAVPRHGPAVIEPRRGRTVVTRSENAWELLATDVPLGYAMMFIVVSANGSRAVSFA